MAFPALRFRVHPGRPERLSLWTRSGEKLNWVYGGVLAATLALSLSLWALIFLAARAAWMAVAGR